MSLHSSRARAIGALVLALLATSTIASGCSEEAYGGGAPRAAPFEPNGTRADEDAGPLTGRICVAVCEAKHRGGIAKDKAIDTCWQNACRGPCIEGSGADPSTLDAGARAPACKTELLSPNDACDDCTRRYCCAAWDECFQDNACADLNACKNACGGEPS